MISVRARIEEFFNTYAQRINEALQGKERDTDEVAGAFANYFVEASPVGVTGSKNDEAFRKMIPKGYEFYRSIGTQLMTITSKDIRFIDDCHSMVTVHWNSVYRKKDNTTETIDFDVHYLVQTKNDIKIFAYITGDEQKVLKEHGLI